jgi:hypothetical protein
VEAVAVGQVPLLIQKQEPLERLILAVAVVEAVTLIILVEHQVAQELLYLNIPTFILSLAAQDLPSQLQHQALSKSQHLPQALAQLVSRRKGNNDNQLNANRLHRRQDFCG